MQYEHGKMAPKGTQHWSHCRYCLFHGWHGPLYECRRYYERDKIEIRNLAEKFRKNLKNGNLKIVITER